MLIPVLPLGLYVDLFSNSRVSELIRQDQFKEMGWRYISGDTLTQQIHALRFWHFTGRRAPVSAV
jgi:hypothetical protein